VTEEGKQHRRRGSTPAEAAQPASAGCGRFQEVVVMTNPMRYVPPAKEDTRVPIDSIYVDPAIASAVAEFVPQAVEALSPLYGEPVLVVTARDGKLQLIWHFGLFRQLRATGAQTVLVWRIELEHRASVLDWAVAFAVSVNEPRYSQCGLQRISSPVGDDHRHRLLN
jgi:hypothetical protein